MEFFDKRTPVLLIEDNHTHQEQIRECLEDEYRISMLDGYDPYELINYKADFPDGQIVIVDLVFPELKVPVAGIEKLKNELWPIDRTALFIVYSGYINEDMAPNFKEVGLNCTILSKGPTEVGGRIGPDSLRSLRQVVDKCRQVSSPVLSKPEIDSNLYRQTIEEFIGKYKPMASADDPRNSSLPSPYREVFDDIRRSTTVISQLTEAAGKFVKAGRQSKFLSIGIFGSAGRLEMRKESDVECTVYYTDEESIDPRSLFALTFWNRITRDIEKLGFPFEGSKRLDPLTKLFDETTLGDGLTNQFEPVINKAIVLPNKDSKDFDNLELLNRHFQILMETRPIFNEDFMFELKREILHDRVGGIKDLVSIINSRYMADVLSVFLRKARPVKIDDFTDLKRFTYRFLNVLALKLYLISKLDAEDIDLSEGDGWRTLFNELCDPGIIKLMRFALYCAGPNFGGKDETSYKRFKQVLRDLVKTYCELLKRMPLNTTNPAGLVQKLNTAGKQFFETFDLLKKFKSQQVHTEESIQLYSIDAEKEIMNRIVAGSN